MSASTKSPRRPGRSLWLSLLIGIAAVGLVVTQRPIALSDTGWIVLASGVGDLVVVLFSLIGMACTGSLAMRSVGVPRLSPVVDVSASVVVGLGSWGALLTVFGLLGVFTPLAMALMSAALFVPSVVWSSRAGVFKDWAAARSEVILIFKSFPTGSYALIVTGSVGIALLLSALGPVREWDSAMYHLSLPGEWLSDGRVFLPSDNLHVAFTGVAHAINGAFLATQSFHAPAILQVIISLLTALTLGSILHRFFSTDAAGWGVLLVWCSTAFVLVASTALVDALVVLVVLLSLAGLIAAVDGDSRAWRMIIVMFGLAGAVKYQAVVYVGAVGLAFLLALLIGKARMDLSRAATFATASLTVFLVLPVVARNFLLFGDPVYPILRGQILSPWLADLTGRQQPVPQATNYLVLSQARKAFNLKDWILAPGLLTAEGTGHLQGFPVIYFVAFASVWSSTGRRAIALTLGPTVVGIAVLILASPATNLRYLLPYVSAFAICGALGLAMIVDRFGRAGLLVALLLVTLGLVPTFRTVARSIGDDGGFRVAVGVESVEGWLERPANEIHEAVRAIGSQLQIVGAERTLLLFEGRGLHFSTPVIQDNTMTNWPLLLDVLEGSCLPKSVATHVVVNDKARDALVARGATDTRWAEWPNFESNCLRYQGSVAGYSLYETVDGPQVSRGFYQIRHLTSKSPTRVN